MFSDIVLNPVTKGLSQAYAKSANFFNKIASPLKNFNPRSPSSASDDMRSSASGSMASVSALPASSAAAHAKQLKQVEQTDELLKQTNELLKPTTIANITKTNATDQNQENIRAHCKKIVARTENKSNHNPDDNIEEQGVKVFLDIDEAVHGIYAAASKVTHGVPHGAEAGIGIGIAGIAAPLGVFALHGGLEEVVESIHDKKKLKNIAVKLKDGLDNLQTLKEKIADKNSEFYKQVEKRELHAKDTLNLIQHHRKQTRRKIGIGAFAISSGLAIITKSVIDIFLHLTSLIKSASAAVAPATAPLSFAGQTVLGPLAALSAVGLGQYFTLKSKKTADYWKDASRLVNDNFSLNDKLNHDQLSNEKNDSQYRHFIREKLNQRVAFTQQFWKKCWHFRAGSMAYAAGTIIPVVVALAGASIGSFGLPLIILGAGGAAYMAYNSLQFLRGHPKQGRYDSYAVCNPAFIDRHYLAQASENRRKEYYDIMTIQQDCHRDLLQRAAISQKKKSKAHTYSETRERQPSTQENIKILWQDFTDKMRKKTLRTADMENWINQVIQGGNESQGQSLADLQASLIQWNQQKIKIEKAKLEDRQNTRKQLKSSQEDYQALETALNKQADLTERNLAKALLLDADLKEATPDNMHKCLHQFVQIQTNHQEDDSPEQDNPKNDKKALTEKNKAIKAFAAFLTKGFEAQQKSERGILIEAEIQAARENMPGSARLSSQDWDLNNDKNSLTHLAQSR